MHVISAEEEPNLNPLVALLGEIDDAQFQLDLLKGMRDGLRGRKSMAMPEKWTTVYPKLSASDNAEVRQLAKLLALVFDDPKVLAALRKTVMDSNAPSDERRTALNALVDKRVPGLASQLQKLLNDKTIRRAAIRGLGAYDDALTPQSLLTRYGTFTVAERQDAVSTLASRPAYAMKLLDGVANGTVARSDISAFTARQLQNMGDAAVRKRLKDAWGEIRQTSKNKLQLISKYKKDLSAKEIEKADLSNGRLVFSKTCMKCHRLFGEGGQIGPDITGSNRANLDYVLENVLDPSAAIGKDYQLTNVVTVGGRLISGIIIERTARAVTVQTENERLVVSKEDIDEIEASPISMMPEGQLDKMTSQQVRDLIAYLGSPVQVPLPKNDATKEN
jgi:putative heme-binding domain-containing protein